MKQKSIEKLTDPEKHQVFICCCPCVFPLSFATHPWFVCNEKGAVSRWEVLFRANKNKNWGHLHTNCYLPFCGLEILPPFKIYWEGTILKTIEGDLAKNLIDFIKESKNNYPHKKYALTGTNSNTYAQWVLNHFKEIELELPWNCFGKDKV